MPQGARLDSVSTLQDLKIALWKFQESALTGLSDAESELNRMLMWVQSEQSTHWKNQIRIRQELVTRAKEAVRMKKIFKDSSGRQMSAVDEEKALQIAMRKLAEAEHKLALVKRWSIQLQKETELYKGGVQRFASSVQTEIPKAAAHLDGLMGNIENYLTMQAAVAVSESEGAAGSSIGRGGTETMPAVVPTGPAIYGLNLTVRPIPSHQRKIFVRMDGHGTEPPGEDAVWIAQGSAEAQSLRISRMPAQDSKPGGWRVGADDNSIPTAWNEMAADILLRIRPDFTELLSLPSGFSVTIDENGVALVRDATERPVWQRGAN